MSKKILALVIIVVLFLQVTVITNGKSLKVKLEQEQIEESTEITNEIEYAGNYSFGNYFILTVERF